MLIKYFNKLDERLGNSVWKWSYDYPVKGKRDISNLDDEEFVKLRRKRNKAVTFMYWIFFSIFWMLSYLQQNLYSLSKIKIYLNKNVSKRRLYY